MVRLRGRAGAVRPLGDARAGGRPGGARLLLAGAPGGGGPAGRVRAPGAGGPGAAGRGVGR
ncbi:hypothetical protein E2C00_33905 [Streptomyces sp. WAC05374]|nr:hypothetical protein EF905_35060 [Streptomyces sp. WAC05374]TDF37709.1 hypothetical protein E2B92_29385 [Streptomyces sp. WAC05374]TDF45618.1 hypothetical protein E2C02_33100 [Streptomyces sp. WAC05374]TDF46533.1 hypothetical protein E2C00_33905 [Streptomyces sp. WAC05374]